MVFSWKSKISSNENWFFLSWLPAKCYHKQFLPHIVQIIGNVFAMKISEIYLSWSDRKLPVCALNLSLLLNVSVNYVIKLKIYSLPWRKNRENRANVARKKWTVKNQKPFLSCTLFIVCYVLVFRSACPLYFALHSNFNKSVKIWSDLFQTSRRVTR